jgi:hypothetical protein
MTQRLFAFVIILAFVLATLAASNAQHKQTNNGLPLVNSQMVVDEEQPPHLLVAPCPIVPRNFPHIDPERRA